MHKLIKENESIIIAMRDIRKQIRGTMARIVPLNNICLPITETTVAINMLTGMLLEPKINAPLSNDLSTFFICL